MIWAIRINSDPATTFEYAGLRLVSVSRANMATSTARLLAVPSNGMTATVFPLRTLVTVLYYPAQPGGPSVVWFKGWVSKATPKISGKSHRIEYEVGNAWYWLERNPYLQTWYALVDPANLAASVVGGLRSRILLGRKVNNLQATIREIVDDVVAQVVTMASTSGLPDVPLQVQSSDFPATYIPTRELQGITHGAVIRECLKYLPDAVAWIDDTTTPPTLRLTRRSGATTRTLTIASGRIGDIGLERQTEMEYSRAAVIYSRTSTVNGTQSAYTEADVYPVPVGFIAADPRTYNSFLLDFGCLTHYVDLMGFGATTFESVLVTRTWDLTSHDWWRNHHAQLDDAITGPGGTGSPVFTPVKVVYEDGTEYEYAGPTGVAPVLDYELVNTGGAIHDGFYLANGDEVLKRRYRVLATVAYQDASGNEFTEKPVWADFTATNAPSGTYRRTVVYQQGEAPPSGLAQELYTALSAARWQGTIPLTAQDIDLVVNLGDLVNITGGRTEWATMNAQVQAIEENPSDGTRTLRVGPVGFLSAADRIELLRWLRNIGPGSGSTPPSLQSSGGVPAVSVPTPSRVPAQNTTQGTDGALVKVVERGDEKVRGTLDGNGRLRLVATDDTSTPLAVKDGAEIDLNLEDAEGSDGNAYLIKVRELSICDDAGVTGKILVPCSEIFYP